MKRSDLPSVLAAFLAAAALLIGLVDHHAVVGMRGLVHPHTFGASAGPLSNESGTTQSSYVTGGVNGPGIGNSAGTGAGNLQITGTSTMQWPASATSPTITQATPTSDVAPRVMTFTAQQPYASATVNKSPAGFTFGLGSEVGGGTPASKLTITADATNLFAFGGDPLLGTLPMMWLGQASPSSANYTLLYQTGTLTINASTAFLFDAAATAVQYVSSNNVTFFNGSAIVSGGGTKVIGLANATTNPSSAPTGGGVLYANGGGGAWRASGNAITNFTAIGSGTQNTQAGTFDASPMGFVRTVSSATPTTIYTYATTSGVGGDLDCRVSSRAATTGTGVAINNFASSRYLLAYQNIGGTVTLSTAGITLVSGSNQTTASALTAPVLTAAASTSNVVISVTNVALATIDSQIYCTAALN